MQYFVIGCEDVVLGFHMAGVAGEVVHELEEAKEIFAKALAQQEVGVILIEDTIAQSMREMVDDYIFSHQFPLICEIPGITGRMSDRRSLRELAVQAMGIKI